MNRKKNKNVLNPLNAFLGIEYVEIIREMVENHRSHDVCWWGTIDGGETPMGGFLQLYLEKSKTTMKVKGLAIYTLHIRLMNVSEEWGNYVVEDSKAVVTYIPVHYYKRDGEDQVFPDLDVQRSERMKAVNYAIEALMNPLAEAVYKGLSYRARDEEYLRLQFSIGEYCEDIIEVKDILCIKHGNRTEEQCMRCHINCNNMDFPSKEMFRTEETEEALEN